MDPVSLLRTHSCSRSCAADAALLKRLDHMILGTIGDDFPVINHDESIHQRQQCRSMRDQHHRLAGRCLLQTALELGFALVIQVAAGLIKQQHGRVIDQGTSHGNGLTLTTRQRLAALTHQHVVALGVIGHKFIHPGNAGCAQHIRLTGKWRPHQQVLLEAAVEQHRVLRHMANGAAQIHRVNLARIHAINQHSTFRRLIQAQHQLFQRCLARANTSGVRDPEPAAMPRPRRHAAIARGDGSAVAVALELGDDLSWPDVLDARSAPDDARGMTTAPDSAPARHWDDGGRLDSREQRRAARELFAAHPPRRLLVAVDARQTPDRGSLGLIAELADHAQSIRVWLAGLDVREAADAGTAGSADRGPTAHGAMEGAMEGAVERGAGAARAGRLRQWREGLAGIGLAGAAADDANVGYTVGGATGQAGRGVGAEGEVVLMDAAAARAWLQHGDEAR